MEDRETARMRKYGESKMTQIMMATVPHVTSGLGLRKFQPDGFLLTRVYQDTWQALINVTEEPISILCIDNFYQWFMVRFSSMLQREYSNKLFLLKL